MESHAKNLMDDASRALSHEWVFDRDRSAEVGRFGPSKMTIQIAGNSASITRTIAGGRIRDTIECRTDGIAVVHTPTDRTIPETVHSGIYRSMSDECSVVGRFEEDGSLSVTETLVLVTSQGKSPATISHRFVLENDGNILCHTVSRSTRTVQTDARYLYTRADGRRAYLIELGENWEIGGDLPLHASLISLQGSVNKSGPRLYFIYPENWDFKFTRPVSEFLKHEKGISFAEIGGLGGALDIFSNDIRGCVIWDMEVRTSLIVAYTIAGLENAIVAAESQLPYVEERGIPVVCDLRQVFTGMTDAEIYRWAYQRYWDRCSRDYIVWLGGEHGDTMRPGVADWGMYKRAFFTDLSTRQSDEEEYTLSRQMLSEQNPQSFVFGWHSYRKDTEGEHVSLTSSFGLRVEGLHTLPNMSFSSQIDLSPGFQFRNNHSVGTDEPCPAEAKVYIACIQTDCLGIGAWTEPGRGEIPYAWEVTMNWVWLAPAMMEFFYSQATPMDYFIGALSGPGYMYPGAVPPAMLPDLIDKARVLMEKLDLRVFDIMDFSKVRNPGGNPDLSPEVVDAYYRGMPDAIGFVNGYFPAHTFTVRDEVPFISFDYYLSPTRPEDDAVADIHELATANAVRPYFLLIHVRNFSDIRRVIRILERLPDEFEVVALDRFLRMAGTNWTFGEWFADDRGTQRYPMD